MLAVGMTVGVAFASAAANHGIKSANLVYTVSPLQLTLTFDDGIKDHYSIAVPELEKRGWRGLFCIITDKVGTDGYVTWDDVRDMVKRGHEIAAHTVSHVDLAALARAGNTNEIRRQVAACCEKIKAETGVRPRLLCLPFTRWTPAVVDIAKTCEKGVSELRGDDQARGRGQAGGGVHRDGRAEPLPVRDPGARAVVKGKWSW